MAFDTSKLNTTNLKKRMPLIVAIIMAIAAVAAVNTYIKQKETSILGRQKKEQMGEVLVAKDDIPAGTVLNEDMILVQVLPLRFIQPRAAGVSDRVVGRATSIPIAKGGQILLTQLTLPGKETTLAAKTPPGKRAITISVDNIAALSGMIKPGDRVDVLGIVPIPMQSQGQVVAQLMNLPLFQDVLILAVGTQITSEAQTVDRYGKKEAPKETSPLITLALNPQEANLLAFVQEQGKVRLVLRSPTDTEVQRTAPATFDTLLQYAAPEMLMQPTQAPPTVEIYRGLKKEEVPLTSSRESR